MPSLLLDLEPLEWMGGLRVRSLNIWLGDGQFRNTMHNDPYDNFLCQVRGSKHLMLYPPAAKPLLGYTNRRDIQAGYSPKQGEYGRKDTGIVSDNTARINMASDRVLEDESYAKAEQQMTYARLEASDCLYLPHGWHHHVFSQPDAAAGYNLAINIWVYRKHEEPGRGWSLDEVQRAVRGAFEGMDELGTASAEAANGVRRQSSSAKHDEL
eukprot:651200-Prymnesium_polylepis.1